MKIKLTQGKFASVGRQDYKYLMQWNWYYLKVRKGEGGYAVRKIWLGNNKWKTIYMHRAILERMGYTSFNRSDHINHNKLDNHRSNLRPATNSQSQCNRSKQSNNTSGYTGVSWHKQSKNGWHVLI